MGRYTPYAVYTYRLYTREHICNMCNWAFIHSFIPDIYLAPLQETYSEALSVQLRPKRNALRGLQKTHISLIVGPYLNLRIKLTLLRNVAFLRHLFICFVLNT